MEWSEELAGGLLQAAPDAILVMDEGRIVLVNDRAEEMLGYAATSCSAGRSTRW